MTNPKSNYKFDLNSDSSNYLNLWKYFTDDAGKIKDKMWTITAFFSTVLGGLLAFAGKMFFEYQDKLTLQNIDHKDPIILIAVVGCIISGFSILMIKKYGDHIRSCRNRANYIRFRIEGLSEIWCFDDPDLIKEDEILKTEIDNRTPKVAVRLMLIMGFYFLIFIVMGIYILILN